MGVHRRGHLHRLRGPDAPQGTAVTLHLKPEDVEDALHDFANPATVRSIVKRYSDFITWPIRMAPPEAG